MVLRSQVGSKIDILKGYRYRSLPKKEKLITVLNKIVIGYSQYKNEVFIYAQPKAKEFLELLYRCGRIGSFFYSSQYSGYIVKLRYFECKPAVSKVSVISKPSRKIYINYYEFVKYLNFNGCLVVRTTFGLLTSQEAFLLRLGGELLFKIF